MHWLGHGVHADALLAATGWAVPAVQSLQSGCRDAEQPARYSPVLHTHRGAWEPRAELEDSELCFVSSTCVN